MSKRGKFIKIVIFFRGLWRRSIYYQYPKCGHGMVGTVGRGRGGVRGKTTSHSFSSMKSKQCCHNLQSNPIGIYQRIAPLQTRTTCYQGKKWRLTKKITQPGLIFCLSIPRCFPFCNELQVGIKTCLIYYCRLC